jgi:hypothetical protein
MFHAVLADMPFLARDQDFDFIPATAAKGAMEGVFCHGVILKRSI